MDLSNDLISKFVKITNDTDKQKSKEGTVYGTAVKYNGSIYVKIDGSDLLTPIDTTADIKEGERVTITIKDHNATVTGNITSPSASRDDVKKVTKNVEEIEGEITEFEAVIADVVHVGELDAEVARIDELLAGKATIEDLTATNAEITNLKAKDAEIENLVADKASIEDLTATNAEITNLKANKASIEDLTATNAEITNLKANKASIEDLTATNAEITNLKANKADITYLDANFATIDQLEATHANIDVLDAEVANINTLVNGNLTSDNILSFNITSKNTTMEDAFIKDAMIDRITANKIMSGIIDTNNVVIQSTDGSMLLQGNILQMKDESGKVRIQIGKDTGGNFTFVLYDESGKGVLIDEEGIKSSDAIADGLIVDAKVADNANISGSKLDIASVITEVNKDNSTTIKSSKIYLNEQNQSLEVAFNSLKTQVEAIQDVTIDGDLSSIVEQVQSNTTQINANKEGINTLVAENVIRTEEISDLEGELQQVNTTLSNKYTSLEQNINGFKTTVNDTYTTKTELAAVDGKFANYSTTSAMNSAINQKANEITSSVSSTYATKSSVDGLSSVYATKTELTQTNNSIVAKFSESGGYNRVRNGAFLTGDLTHWSDWGTCTRVVENSTDSGLGKVVKITTTGTNQGIQQTITGLVAGKKYIVSALVWASSGQGVFQLHNNGAYSSDVTKSTGKFEHLSVSFTAGSSSVTVRLGRSAGGSNGTYYFTGILLTEGETKLPWSPHPSEIYEGITKIDKDGIKVTQSNYNGYTQMKADGFYVNNGSENVISITKDGSYFKGKVVVTSGSTVPTSVLSGTISSSQLNSTITSDISTAKTNASNAVSTANTASTNASNAVSTANTASTNASTAVSTANTASTNASNAVKTANTASTNASTAVSTANTAKSTADSVKSTVDSGKTNWNNAYNRVNEWAYGAVTGSTTIDGGYVQTGTIVADKIAANAIIAAKIASGAITADKIAAGAITADKLAANAITSKTITGSTITGGTINGATITSETLMKSYGGVYVGSELWGGFKKDSNGNYSSAQTFTIHGSTALQIDGNPTRISSVTGEVKIGDASSYDNLRARCLYAQEIVYTDDIRSRTTGNALLMENISMRSTNAYVQFTSGLGVVRVKERNHLYLQTGGNTGGDTSAEIRCTRYSDASNYVNIRAHNVCAQNAVYAAGVNVSSDRARKRDIELYSTDALQEVCSTPVYAYHLDTDKDEELKRIGIIMQEAPLDAIDLTGKGVDLYQMVTMLWKATQQQQEMIEDLKRQLKGE